MSQPEAPNPERRSNAALLCLCLGIGLGVLAWFLGLGAAIATVGAGDNPAAIAGGIGAAIGLGLLGVSAAILSLVGVIWLFVQVIADQRDEHKKERYSRDVER